MRVRVYSMEPYHDAPGYFINILGKETFDPSHPTEYPGAEVEAVETLPLTDAKDKYMRDGVIIEPYTVRNSGYLDCTVTILRLTGRTSADVIRDHNNRISEIRSKQ